MKQLQQALFTTTTVHNDHICQSPIKAKDTISIIKWVCVLCFKSSDAIWQNIKWLFTENIPFHSALRSNIILLVEVRHQWNHKSFHVLRPNVKPYMTSPYLIWAAVEENDFCRSTMPLLLTQILWSQKTYVEYSWQVLLVLFRELSLQFL